MSFIRINKRTNYSVIDNIPLEDKNLSWGAKGLLVYLLHLPDDWKINISDLTNRSKDGRDSTGAKIRELIENGYIKRSKTRNKKGVFSGYEYNVYERPNTENPFSDKPVTENPITDNPALLNTNLTNVAGKLNFDKDSNKLNVINTNDSIESLSFYCPYCFEEIVLKDDIFFKENSDKGVICGKCRIFTYAYKTVKQLQYFCKSMNKNYKYYTLAELLYMEHLKVNENFLIGKDLVKILLGWASEIRLLYETDLKKKVDLETIKKVIVWCQQHDTGRDTGFPGWKYVILSGKKFRKQFKDYLYVQYQKQNKKDNSLNGYLEPARRIIKALNKLTRINKEKLPAFPFEDLPVYDYSSYEILKYPIAILKMGRTESECIQVIDTMCSRWKVDGKMREFLRPSTLFKPEKFPGYLAKTKQVWCTEDEGATWKLQE